MAADKEAAMSVLNISQIMEILPHRQPMLLIDSVEEIEYGVRAVAKKCVSFNEPFFAGHFPAERQGSRGTVENEKRLSHTASVGRRDKRSENAKVQGE